MMKHDTQLVMNVLGLIMSSSVNAIGARARSFEAEFFSF